ncbi:MAG TPA: FUSC family protein, partial [Franconibacter pulveris]|nr:FUSC family protein [Franconibacter pulveris]
LLKLCQRDLRRSLKGVLKRDETYWTNLMIDRAALLLPRLQRSGHASQLALNHLLHALRIGLCVMQLRRCDTQADAELSEALSLLSRTTDTDALRPRIAAMAARCLPAADDASGQWVDGLVDLHCWLREMNKEPAYDQ